jgi:fucose permease
LQLGIVSMVCAIAEGGFSDWIGVYLNIQVGTSTAIAALGFVFFAAALTGGRTFGDRATMVLGNIGIVRLSGAAAALGIVILLSASTVAVALIAVTVCGLGLSALNPRILAAAARPGNNESVTLTRVIGMSTIGTFLGPPLLGTTSALFGLSAALAIPAICAVVIGMSARVVNHESAQPRVFGSSGDIAEAQQ